MEATRDDQGDLANMLEADERPRTSAKPQPAARATAPRSSSPQIAQADGGRSSAPSPQPRPKAGLQPASNPPPAKSGGGAALYVVIALVVLAAAGAAAWFGGLIPH